MEFRTLVAKARTCRRFNEQERVDIAIISWLLDCARLVPCGRNAQVLRYSIAHSKEACEKIFPYTNWAGALKELGKPIEGERPTAYIAIMTPKKCTKIPHIDAGIAAQTIQLAAETREIGCCMHASFNPIECAKIFEVPEDMEICLLLALGMAKETRVIVPMPDNTDFNYWRNDEQVHHVPKRSLENIILRTF